MGLLFLLFKFLLFSSVFHVSNHGLQTELARMGGSLLSKAEVPGSSLLGHLPKEFSFRLTWCPWLVGYYDTRGISRGARKRVQKHSLSKKKKIMDFTVRLGG